MSHVLKMLLRPGVPLNTLVKNVGNSVARSVVASAPSREAQSIPNDEDGDEQRRRKWGGKRL